MASEDAYSQTADQQLDALEAGADPDLWNAVLDAIELIFDAPGLAQSHSSAITTDQVDTILFRLPVAGHYPYKVFWTRTSAGPRIEAVFPHP